MKIALVTDSTADLPQEVISKYDISVIPMYINVGEKGYLDGVEMTREEFYTRLPDFKPHPTTAVPGIDAFVDVFRKAIDKGAEAIISLHIGKALSNTVDVARLAAEKIKEIPVHVFDPGNLSLGTGLLVREAAIMAEAGEKVKVILEVIADKAKRTYTFAVLSTLEFLRRSGRLSNFMFSLGSLLILKPILKMNDGVTDMERTRTFNGSHNRLMQLVEELGELEQLAFVHTHAPEKLALLQQEAAYLVPEGTIPLVGEVSPVIGAHIGPGAVGFSVIKAA
ncbi:MAG: DegV family protein [Anaerolineaceae bacterium]|nr:DegV family protein [Anaerolineaceae bacterium]